MTIKLMKIPIEVTLVGIMAEVNIVQLKKTQSSNNRVSIKYVLAMMVIMMMVMVPISVTLAGIVTVVSQWHPSKAPLPNRILR